MTENQPLLVTLSQIAHLLGVQRQQVSAWKSRRKNNGFPEPTTDYQRRDRLFDLYLWEEVQDWHKNYTPAKGGAPRGARNGRSKLRREVDH